MGKPKLSIIRPQLGFGNLSDPDLLTRLNQVYDGLFNNPAYPAPLVDMATFKAKIDAFTTAATAAVDGGKAQTVARDKCRVDVLIDLRLLAQYVESACKNDMQTFVSSGFVAASSVRTPPRPVSQTTIVAIDQGSPGQFFVTIKPVAKARHYEIRYAPVPTAGAAAVYTTATASSTKPPTPVNGLTPGTTYTFQVRAFGKLGYSDWSPSVERMCI